MNAKEKHLSLLNETGRKSYIELTEEGKILPDVAFKICYRSHGLKLAKEK